MQKMVIILFCIMVFYLNSEEKLENENVIIPENSIRFRVIANSNSAQDQIIKYDLVNEITSIIQEIEKSNNIENSREVINNSIPIIEEKLKELNLNGVVNFGQNYFPEKNYSNIVYSEGNYESLVITIGDGIGDNWWCVLFPPLCLIEKEKEKIDETEYSWYIKNILNKYF